MEYRAHISIELADEIDTTQTSKATRTFQGLMVPLLNAFRTAGIECLDLGTNGLTVDLFWFRDTPLDAQDVMAQALVLVQNEGWIPISASCIEENNEVAEA